MFLAWRFETRDGFGVVISIALGTSMNGEFFDPAIKNITTLGAGVADPVEGLAIFIS